VNSAWTQDPDSFVRDQMRYGDFNSDGLMDVAIALFTKWDPHPKCTKPGDDCRSYPDPHSLYSELWFGDGYGDFIPSGLSAGPPALIEVPKTSTTRNRTWWTSWSTQDLDRDNSPELIASRDDTAGAMSLWAARFRGLHTGFALLLAMLNVPIEDENGNVLETRQLVIEGPADIDLGLAYTGMGDDCF
jgi:hypothetical protein